MAILGSDNDNPKIFGDEQLYVVIEQAYGGTEYNQFSTARQSLAVFKQVKPLKKKRLNAAKSLSHEFIILVGV